MSTLHTGLARLEASASGNQHELREINATGFFPMDKRVVRTLHEDETLKDFTFLLADGKQLKINSFLAAMMSEAVQVKLSTAVGSGRPRMTYDLKHFKFELLEKLISLTLADTLGVHDSELLDLFSLANELRFPERLRAWLDLELEKVLDQETSAIETEIGVLYRDVMDAVIQRAKKVTPKKKLPDRYGFYLHIFRSPHELVLGEYYGVWDGQVFRPKVLCGTFVISDDSVYVKDPDSGLLTISLCTLLRPLKSFDRIRPKTAYPPLGSHQTQCLSDMGFKDVPDAIGTFCEITLGPTIPRKRDKVLLLGIFSLARMYVLYQGSVHSVMASDLFRIVPPDSKASEDEKHRAWVAVSSGPPPARRYSRPCSVNSDYSLEVGRYYECNFNSLVGGYNRTIVSVLYLGVVSSSQNVYVLFDGDVLQVDRSHLYFEGAVEGGNV